MILEELYKNKLINIPKFIINNCHYLTLMGSAAYGIETKNSDVDIYGFCIPPKEVIFPHLNGAIIGFGKQNNSFREWQQHNILNPENNKLYDFTIYNIINYFDLCMKSNPNMLDSLFTNKEHVVHITQVGQLVKDNRKLFLSKKIYFKFKGYALSQFKKMKSLNRESKERKESILKYGYETKFAYHLIRLLNECEQILLENDLDLTKNIEILRQIRNGEWKIEQVEKYFYDKEKIIEDLYHKSNLIEEPNENEIKKILVSCIEHHYGNIDNCIKKESNSDVILRKIKDLLNEN